jgi:glycosyltransferase involved in cell wall biosynthesis
MRVGLVAPPFISVPPSRYGGTELFIAHLAAGLQKLGHEVVLYANGESSAPVECRWIYPRSEWPIRGEIHANLKDINHTAWAVADAQRDCDLVHINNAPGLAFSRFTSLPMVYTIHHPHEEGLTAFYRFYPDTQYVTISHFQRLLEPLPRIRTIHHGLNFSRYTLQTEKQDYLAFIGRIAPMKGTHLAIEVAHRSGLPLKIAGEVQPIFRDYFESKVKPRLDGRNVEYIGEADMEAKNELLGHARALLFPVQWNEPFGLVMIEAMACGTPVLAFPGGSVPEIVQDGISGWICRAGVDEMASRAALLDNFRPADIRAYAERNFSLAHMVEQYAALYETVVSRHRAQEPLRGTTRAAA